MLGSPLRTANWAHSFRYGDFRLLWASTFFYTLGAGMDQLAVGWLAFDLTGSAFIVGVAYAARAAPQFFLGFFSGAMADWLERRILLRFIGVGAGIAAGLMALLILADLVRVWSFMAMTAVIGAIFAFHQTATPAYTYDIVGPDHALNGLSLIAISNQIGQLGGALIAGGLIAVFGPGWAYMAVGAGSLVSASILLAAGKLGRVSQFRRESLLRNVIGYAQMIGQNHVLLLLMCLASVTEVLGFTHATLFPVFAKEVIGVGPLWLGLMSAARQGGGLFGLAILASLRDYRRKGLLVFIAAASCGAGLMAFSLSSNLYVFLGIVALTNVACMATDTLYKTLMQDNVPDEQRGRAMGSWVFSVGVAPAGHLGVGGLASFLGAPRALLINGSVLVFVNLATAIGLPKIRRLE